MEWCYSSNHRMLLKQDIIEEQNAIILLLDRLDQMSVTYLSAGKKTSDGYIDVR